MRLLLAVAVLAACLAGGCLSPQPAVQGRHYTLGMHAGPMPSSETLTAALDAEIGKAGASGNMSEGESQRARAIVRQLDIRRVNDKVWAVSYDFPATADMKAYIPDCTVSALRSLVDSRWPPVTEDGRPLVVAPGTH
jgi:hypothetical protein